jgi:predicted RNA polymerase sigma factor
MGEAYHLARADFLVRLERLDEADAAYAEAAGATRHDHVRDFVARRRQWLAGRDRPADEGQR